MSYVDHHDTIDTIQKPNMRSAKTSLHNLYDMYTADLRTIDFYKEEIQYLTKRLEDIIKANTRADILALSEEFQNRFIVTKNNLDELKHNVAKALGIAERMIIQKPTHTDEKMITDSGKYSMNLHALEKEFAEMKFQFNTFLSKYL